MSMTETAALFITKHGECPNLHYLAGALPSKPVGQRAETLIPIRTPIQQLIWLQEKEYDDDRYDNDYDDPDYIDDEE